MGSGQLDLPCYPDLAGRFLMGIEDLKKRSTALRHNRDHLRSQKDRLTSEITQLEAREEILALSSELLKKLIDSEVVQGVKSIESLISEGLQAVFHDQKIGLRAEVEEKRGKVNVSFVTSQNGIEGKTLDAFGGAVSTVQSILLRLAIILKRGLRPLLLLDESLPAFDSGYIHLMADFLSTLCHRLGVSILLVTHNPNLVDAAHLSYKISRSGASAKLTKI